MLEVLDIQENITLPNSESTSTGSQERSLEQIKTLALARLQVPVHAASISQSSIHWTTGVPGVLVKLAFNAATYCKDALGAYVVCEQGGRRFLVYQRRLDELRWVFVSPKGDLSQLIAEVRRQHFMVRHSLWDAQGARELLDDPLAVAAARGELKPIQDSLKDMDIPRRLRIYSVAVACKKPLIADAVARQAGEQRVVNGQFNLGLLFRYATKAQISTWKIERSFTLDELGALMANPHASLDAMIRDCVSAGSRDRVKLLLRFGILRRIDAYFHRPGYLPLKADVLEVWKFHPEWRILLLNQYPNIVVSLHSESKIQLSDERLIRWAFKQLDDSLLIEVALQARELPLRLAVEALRTRCRLNAVELVARHRYPERIWVYLVDKERSDVFDVVAGAKANNPSKLSFGLVQAVVTAGTAQEIKSMCEQAKKGLMGPIRLQHIALRMAHLSEETAVPSYAHVTQIHCVAQELMMGYSGSVAWCVRQLQNAIARGSFELVSLWLSFKPKLTQEQRAGVFGCAVDMADLGSLDALHDAGLLPENKYVDRLIELGMDEVVQWLIDRDLLSDSDRLRYAQTACEKGRGTAFRILMPLSHQVMTFWLNGKGLDEWEQYQSVEQFEDALYKLFLNSNYEDWIANASWVPCQSPLYQSVARVRTEIETAGSLIARFSSARFQREIQAVYGRAGVSYEQQQREYAQERESVFQSLLQLMRTRNIGLADAYGVLMHARRFQPSAFGQFRAGNNKGFGTPIVRADLAIHNRYRYFYPLVIAEARARQAKGQENPRVGLYDHVLPIGYGLLGTRIRECKLRSRDPLILVWDHTSSDTVVEIQDHLSKEFEAIKNMKNVALPELKRSIGLLYARLSHAALTRRGNAQYALELHRLLYALHGYQVAPPSRKAVLPDCIALSCTPERFVEKYYDMCFSKFSETGDFIRLVKSS